MRPRALVFVCFVIVAGALAWAQDIYRENRGLRRANRLLLLHANEHCNRVSALLRPSTPPDAFAVLQYEVPFCAHRRGPFGGAAIIPLRDAQDPTLGEPVP